MNHDIQKQRIYTCFHLNITWVGFIWLRNVIEDANGAARKSCYYADGLFCAIFFSVHRFPLWVNDEVKLSLMQLAIYDQLVLTGYTITCKYLQTVSKKTGFFVFKLWASCLFFN